MSERPVSDRPIKMQKTEKSDSKEEKESTPMSTWEPVSEFDLDAYVTPSASCSTSSSSSSYYQSSSSSGSLSSFYTPSSSSSSSFNATPYSHCNTPWDFTEKDVVSKDCHFSLGQVNSEIGKYPDLSDKKSKRELVMEDSVVLNEYEEKVKRWCTGANLKFIPPNGTSHLRLDEQHPERVLYYLDSNTIMAMSVLEGYAKEHHPEEPRKKKAKWQWVLQYTPLVPVYESYRASISARAARAAVDLENKQHNKEKRDAMTRLIDERERIWIDDLNNY